MKRVARMRHESSAGVQQAACGGLRNLASESSRERIASAGGIEMALGAMRRHDSSAGVQAAGREALSVLR